MTEQEIDYIFNNIDSVDFYTNNPTQFIEDISKHYTEIKTDLPNAVNFKFKDTILQITNYPYRTPLETIHNFDYTVCCMAFDGVEVIQCETFWEDLNNKTLRIRKNNMSPFHALERLVKYSRRGFTPTQETMLRTFKEDRKSTRLNSSHVSESRMPSSA